MCWSGEDHVQCDRLSGDLAFKFDAYNWQERSRSIADGSVYVSA